MRSWLTTPLLFVALGCVSPGPSRAGDEIPATAASAEASSPVRNPDKPSLMVAAEFHNRLKRNVGGSLRSFRETHGVITAEWVSSKCDFLEGEVIDLLVSIHREFTREVASIKGVRECAQETRHLTLAGADFAAYRTGRINDVEVLKRLVE